MVRPRLPRKVGFYPNATYFKPAGIPLNELEQESLTHDEVEAIRLIDHDEVEQKKACKKMNISQPTLSRLLKAARKKISQALIHGKAIKISEDNIPMVKPKGFPGAGRGRGFGMGRPRKGRGRMSGDKAGAGPGGNCICPSCGYSERQVRGQPCMNKKCPKCGSRMTRE